MVTQIDYYFSLISPWTYLGAARLEEIAARHRARVLVKPVDYGQIFPVSGGLPLAKRAKQRQDYRLVELKRWREYAGVPLTLQPAFFPAAEGLAARMVIAAAGQGADALGLAHAILRAVWAEERNIADRDTLRAIARSLRLDDSGLLAAAETPPIIAAYAANTAEAIASGVFGAPTYIVEGEMFWGQDRLDFLDRALAKHVAA